MLIVIPKDFLELNDNSLEFNNCIENLLAAGFEGNHYIISEHPMTARNILETCNVSARAKAILLKLSGTSRESFPLISLVQYYACITSFKGKRCDESTTITRGIAVDLSYFESIAHSLPCRLLCEDSKDGEIYEQYFNIILKKKTKYLPASVKFTILHGGGSSTPSHYKRVFDSNFPVLCIVDNDTKEPNGKGNYWEKLEEIGEKAFAKFKVVCGHEIENSIPLKILHDICNLNDNGDFFQIVKKSAESNLSFHLYFDFKEGIVKKDIRKLSKDYRDTLLNFFINNCLMDHGLFTCLEKECAENCSNCKVVSGFGKKLIETFYSEFQQLSPQKKCECLADSTIKNYLGTIYDDAVACGLASKKIRL